MRGSPSLVTFLAKQGGDAAAGRDGRRPPHESAGARRAIL